MVFGVGCGDDSGGDDDDCVGHLCGGDVTIADNEGGQVIFEFIYFDTELQAAFSLPTGVTTALRTMAYFMEEQTPESNPLPQPGICNNLETTKGWPIFVGNPHVDVDVGTLTITGKKGDGSAVSIPVPKQAAGNDSINRPHDIFYQTIQPQAENFLLPDSAYDVSFSGSATIPATTMTGGLFLAHGMVVDDLENNGPMIGGTNFTVTWDYTPSTNLPEGAADDVVIWLVDTNGKPTHMCPTPAAANTFTIPGSTITEYKAAATARGTATTKVILLRNTIVHQLQRLPLAEAENKRRIDMVSIHCWAQLMDVQ
ncbi:MAG: hypothetical protein ABI867_05210 [Kofleriaceae bacterium]